MRQANQQFSSVLTKIGNGGQLDEIQIALIESPFCTVEEVEARCPQGTFISLKQFEDLIKSPQRDDDDPKETLVQHLISLWDWMKALFSSFSCAISNQS
ncbi:hypothetical protein TNCV_4557471 [Trichonephila clavipes]|nr:hypothetical protein TNCV_4557471 [Trichonephila clavipes]